MQILIQDSVVEVQEAEKPLVRRPRPLLHGLPWVFRLASTDNWVHLVVMHIRANAS